MPVHPLLALLAILPMSHQMNQSGQEGPQMIAKAMAATREAIPVAAQDATRPAYHFHTPAQWMNDPNGPIYWQGWYHVFYQFNPYGDQWDHMHWGHARSRDLVNWEHLPVAVWPSKSKGEDHVYSGSTHIDGHGKPAIFYTSIGPRDPEQWIVHPADAELLTWTKPDVNPVVSFATQSPTKLDEWRDPFLFDEGGATYMVTGGRHDGHGIVALYKAENPELTKWHYLGILFQHPDSNLVECPNIVKLGDQWVLLTSHDGRVDWFSGSLDLAAHAFHSEHRGVLAEGSYASQLMRDKNGRCIHLAWVPTNNHHGWNGFMTLPSVLTLDKSGDLLRNPISDFEKLRSEKIAFGSFELDREIDLSDRVYGDMYEVVADIDPGTAAKVTLKMLASEDGARGVTVTYDAREHKLLTTNRSPATITEKGDLRLHIFLDKASLDVYADGGRVTQAVALDPNSVDLCFRVGAEGGTAKVKSLTVYKMKPAEFDLKHFK